MSEKQVKAFRPLLSVEDVAKLFSVHKQTVLKAIRAKSAHFPEPINISPTSKRPTYRFVEDDVYRFIANIK